MYARRTVPLDPLHPLNADELNADEREQAPLWDHAIHDSVNQQTLKFILGQRPRSEWDAYVAELKAKNSDEYLTVINNAYTATSSSTG